MGSETGINTVATLIRNSSVLKTLNDILGKVDIGDLLYNDAEPVTVFAPVDDAFKALPPDVMAALLKPENKHKLTELIRYHITPGEVKVWDLVEMSDILTMQGTKLRITQYPYGVLINGSVMYRADVCASNGVIHLLDDVLIPQTLDLKLKAA